MTLVRKAAAVMAGMTGIAVSVAVAQTAAPEAAKPLTAAEASECRAVAEVLRDRQYQIMDSLIIRVERSPNLSPEGLEAAKKSVSDTEAAIKAAEKHTERFVFAPAASQAVKTALTKEEPEALKLRLSECLKRMPEDGVLASTAK